MSLSLRLVVGFLSMFALSAAGCGGSGLAGCPSDLAIPAEMVVLGSQYDQGLFILRLKTDEHRIPEVVEVFKKTMKDDDWRIKSDSASSSGGELEFSKEDRLCRLFIAPERKTESETVKIDIRCDRESRR